MISQQANFELLNSVLPVSISVQLGPTPTFDLLMFKPNAWTWSHKKCTKSANTYCQPDWIWFLNFGMCVREQRRWKTLDSFYWICLLQLFSIRVPLCLTLSLSIIAAWPLMAKLHYFFKAQRTVNKMQLQMLFCGFWKVHHKDWKVVLRSREVTCATEK